MILITEMRRKRIKSRLFPPQWLSVLERNVPLYCRLPVKDRDELHGHVQVFLSEKSFEGKRSMEVTDQVRVTIAASACILLLHRQTDYYPGLSSVIVYPGEYLASHLEMDECGIVTEGTDCRSGETSPDGALVLSWEDVLAEEIDVHPGYNVVLHEFAHLLDAEDGIISGTPLLPRRFRYRMLREVLQREFERIREDVRHRRTTVIDPYGAEGPDEFFAVATEAFFETPHLVRTQHPELYLELAGYYRQDPDAWTASGFEPPASAI